MRIQMSVDVSRDIVGQEVDEVNLRGRFLRLLRGSTEPGRRPDKRRETRSPRRLHGNNPAD